jgi:hypothetical protein
MGFDDHSSLPGTPGHTLDTHTTYWCCQQAWEGLSVSKWYLLYGWTPLSPRSLGCRYTAGLSRHCLHG